MLRFACLWVVAVAACLILYGAGLLVAALMRLDAMLLSALQVDYANLPVGIEHAAQQLWFAVAGVGALSIGWGIMIIFLALNALSQGERWAWWACLTSLSVWFVSNTALSAALSANGNIAVNVGILMAFAVPLALIKWVNSKGLEKPPKQPSSGFSRTIESH